MATPDVFDRQVTIHRWTAAFSEGRQVSNKDFFWLGVDIARLQSNYNGQENFHPGLITLETDQALFQINCQPNLNRPRVVCYDTTFETGLHQQKLAIEVERSRLLWWEKYDLFLPFHPFYSHFIQDDLLKTTIRQPLYFFDYQRMAACTNLWNAFLYTPPPGGSFAPPKPSMLR